MPRTSSTKTTPDQLIRRRKRALKRTIGRFDASTTNTAKRIASGEISSKQFAAAVSVQRNLAAARTSLSKSRSTKATVPIRKSPGAPGDPVATRAGTATRRGIIRGLREVGGVVAPNVPIFESTSTARVQGGLSRLIRTGRDRAIQETISSVRSSKGPTGGAALRTLREVKKFGVGFFGR